MFEGLGKTLIIVGVFLVIFGIVFVFWNKIPLIGRLPGDIVIQKGGFTFFFPMVTSLVLSLVLTIVLNVIFRVFK